MNPDTPRRMRAIVHELIDALAAGDAARITALYADDATVEATGGTEPHRVSRRPVGLSQTGLI